MTSSRSPVRPYPPLNSSSPPTAEPPSSDLVPLAAGLSATTGASGFYLVKSGTWSSARGWWLFLMLAPRGADGRSGRGCKAGRQDGGHGGDWPAHSTTRLPDQLARGGGPAGQLLHLVGGGAEVRISTTWRDWDWLFSTKRRRDLPTSWPPRALLQSLLLLLLGGKVPAEPPSAFLIPPFPLLLLFLLLLLLLFPSKPFSPYYSLPFPFEAFQILVIAKELLQKPPHASFKINVGEL